jgi:hypothetical protein
MTQFPSALRPMHGMIFSSGMKQLVISAAFTRFIDIVFPYGKIKYSFKER